MDGKILILLYHKICELERDWNELSVKPETFINQMRYLKSKYTIIRSDDDWNQCSQDAVVITFDDGFEDNYTNAFPILEKLQIPATFFISTGNIDSENEIWCNELVKVIFEKTSKNKCFVSQQGSIQFELETNGLYQCVELYRVLRQLLMRVSNTERNHIMNDLRKWGNIVQESGRPAYKMMTTDQIKGLSKSEYMTIGAHTVNHPSLGALSYGEQLYEIIESKENLESITEKEVKLFSYPFGQESDYSDQTIKILQSVGFEKAMTTNFAVVKDGFDNFRIPRIGIKECSLDSFVKCIDSHFMSVNLCEKKKEPYIFKYIGKMEQDKELFDTDKSIVIWGAGNEGRRVVQQLKKWNLINRVKKFYDRSTSKVGGKIEGIPIYNIENICDVNESIIIVALINIETIFEYIKKLELYDLHYYL